jgi:hypothetical protein
VSVNLQLAVNEAAARPGDWVRGRVTATSGGSSRSLEVSLHYREKTDDYSATGRTETVPPLHTGDLTTGQTFDYAIQLPVDALPNFETFNGSLSWVVEARSDQLGRDAVATRPLAVG